MTLSHKDALRFTKLAAIAQRKAHAVAESLDSSSSLPCLVRYETDELPLLGSIQIDSTGDENIYFTTADGLLGYCKY